MKDDLISRQEAIDLWDKYHPFIAIKAMEYDRALRALPSAEPERKRGKWIDNNGLYQCSACKHIWSELWWTSVCPIDRMNKMMHYCPNCGVKMDEREELQ